MAFSAAGTVDNIKGKSKFIPFSAPLLEKEEIAAVINCINSGWVGTGPVASKFEEEFAKFKGVEQAVAVNSCTAALHLSLIASGVQVGDEVITTSMTFCSTVNAIIHSGATPILVDIDFETQNIAPEKIEEKITSKTRAIIVVHFAGQVCNMLEITSLAAKYNLKVIEDCAHAIESKYNGEPAGTLGDFGCFSFYSTKNITTIEGGMVISKNLVDLEKIKVLSLHGMNRDAWSRYSSSGFKHYDVVSAGFKYNMTDVQAAIGIEQLKKIDKFYTIRSSIWNYFIEELGNLPITLPVYQKSANSVHAHHLFTMQIKTNKKKIDRDLFIARMHENGIGVGVHYKSIPSFSYYQNNYGWKEGEWPVSQKIGSSTVSLPLSPKLSSENIEHIVRTVQKVLK